MAVNIDKITDEANVARLLSDEELAEIGNSLGEQIEMDENSRSDWLERNERWLRLAEQVTEPKNFPWPNASNVKFPLLNVAAIQFHARSFPALLGNRELVKTRRVGDYTPDKAARGQRVGTFMSYQCIDGMESWMDEMDRMLFLLPIVGLVYKKSFYSIANEMIRSDVVNARDVIVNYHATDFNRARVTHRIWQDINEITEYINADIYLDADLSTPVQKQVPGIRDEAQGLNSPGIQDDLAPYEIYESHCWWDLDDDGYKEPYIITLERSTRKVLRIVARWRNGAIKKRSNGRVIKIKPINFFTQYKFIPDPESKIYALGFGSLLGPTNEAVNTLINQLIDAGTLSTLGGGFLSRGVRTKGGAIRFTPGEWKQLQTTSEDLRKGIMPLPIREPSLVLFQLLGLLIDSGRDLSSVQDVMVGRNPGQNQPYATTEAVVEQGLKVFNGIYKRVYRALTEEFKKIYTLNYLYVSNEQYQNILDNPDADILKDFETISIDIVPTAEPDMVAEAQKIMRAHGLFEKIQAGLRINVDEATRLILEAEGYENIEALMNVPPPQPDPEQVRKDKELEHKIEMDYAHLRLDSLKVKEQALRDRANAIATLRKVDLAEAELGVDVDKHAVEELHKQRDEVIRAIEAETKLITAKKQAQQSNVQSTE